MCTINLPLNNRILCAEQYYYYTYLVRVQLQLRHVNYYYYSQYAHTSSEGKIAFVKYNNKIYQITAARMHWTSIQCHLT